VFVFVCTIFACFKRLEIVFFFSFQDKSLELFYENFRTTSPEYTFVESISEASHLLLVPSLLPCVWLESRGPFGWGAAVAERLLREYTLYMRVGSVP
jgi:hypothetical protein